MNNMSQSAVTGNNYYPPQIPGASGNHCPRCGYCPHCGRGGEQNLSPQMMPQTMPYWNGVQGQAAPTPVFGIGLTGFNYMM